MSMMRPTPHILLRFCFLALALLLAAAQHAQAQTPTVDVTATLKPSPLIAGRDAAIVVTVNVPPGLHIQSRTPYDAYLVAMQIKVNAAPAITVDAPQYPKPKDIPAPPGASSQPMLSVYEGRVSVRIPLHVAADAAAGDSPRTIDLSVRTQACDDQSCFAPATAKISLPAPILPASAAAPPAAPLHYFAANAAEGALAWWQLLLFALAGGAILNIMPCVLPVIPLKVMALIQQAHGRRKTAILHALVFASGIVTLFVLLGLALGLYGLATGTTVVYGQQFQSTAFLLTMALIVLALALSMLGVWTITPPTAVYNADQPRSGYAGSFMSGLLATLLATPCSAPYLGPVLAWAFTQPLLVAVLVLALVGVGMAIPYVVLAAFPAGLDKLPRTGRWSELLKQFLGLILLGVALYLISTIPNPALWPWAMLSALLVAMACWAWGQIPTPNWPRPRLWTFRTILLLLTAALILIAQHLLLPAGLAAANPDASSGGGTTSTSPAAPPPSTTAATPDSALLPWQPFSLAALQRGLADHRIVIIDWTATWCINCRVVEATVLDSDPVQQAFREKNVLLLKADISSPNPAAEKLMQDLGSRSIPFLAIFSPARPQSPVVLRDLYSRDRVLREVQAAAPPRP